MADTVEAQKPPQEKAEQLQEKAQEIAGQARDKTQEVAGEARSRLRGELDQRSTRAAERIAATGSDLRSVGEELRKQGKDTPARLAGQAADRVERVGGYLAESDADRMLRDIEDFGRRQPLAMLAGGMVLGIVAARFLKASSNRRYRSHTALSNGASDSVHAYHTVPTSEAGSVPPGSHVTGARDVQPATPDPGEHHQRFEGHS